MAQRRRDVWIVSSVPFLFPALRVAGIVAGSVPATRASGAWDNAQALAGMSGDGLAAFF